MKRVRSENINIPGKENTNEPSTSTSNIENIDFLERDEENHLNGGIGKSGEPPTKKKRTSAMWKHFSIVFSTEENVDFAHCKHCTKNFRLGGKSNHSTGNLIRHMKNEHQDIYRPNTNQEQQNFMFSEDRYRDARRDALIKWIIHSDQPFCTCQQEDFVKLLNTLNPKAASFSAQTVKRDIIKKFNECVGDIKTRLAKVSSKFAFTVDGWTSKNVLPFMNIRAHWLNDDFTYESVIVDFVYLEGKHSGENLCKHFVDCLKQFDIPLSKVSALTMDNVSSNDTFMTFLTKHGIKTGTHITSCTNRVRCLPHVMNLAVQDILASLKIPLNFEEDQYAYLDREDEEYDESTNPTALEDDVVEESEEEEEEDVEKEAELNPSEAHTSTISKLRKLIKRIRKSSQMRQKLRKVCSLFGMEYLTPIIDVATRWDSTFDMLERAIYLKDALGVMCTKEKSLKNVVMTDREWSELDPLRSLLKKFRRSTKFMSMERHPTMCAFLPTFRWIKESVESFIEENPGNLAHAAHEGLVKLLKYEQELQISKCNIAYIAVFLNPALKMNYFKEHGYTKAQIRDIQKLICETFELNYGGATGDKDDNVDEEPQDEFLTHMYKRSKTNREPKEFQKYLNATLSNPKVNILEFWRGQKEEYPNLSISNM